MEGSGTGPPPRGGGAHHRAARRSRREEGSSADLPHPGHARDPAQRSRLRHRPGALPGARRRIRLPPLPRSAGGEGLHLRPLGPRGREPPGGRLLPGGQREGRRHRTGPRRPARPGPRAARRPGPDRRARGRPGRDRPIAAGRLRLRIRYRGAPRRAGGLRAPRGLVGALSLPGAVGHTGGRAAGGPAGARRGAARHRDGRRPGRRHAPARRLPLGDVEVRKP